MTSEHVNGFKSMQLHALNVDDDRHRAWRAENPGEPADLVAPEVATLQSIIRDHPGLNEIDPPRPVHFVNRLDRGTSGIIVIAKNPVAARYMQENWHRSLKGYVAFCRGGCQEDFVVDRPLQDYDKKRLKPRQKRALKKSGRAPDNSEKVLKPCTTSFHPLKTIGEGNFSVIHCLLTEGGKMHQIRRHLAGVNRHIFGDVAHGLSRFNRWLESDYGCNRLMLHSESLEAPLPDGTFAKVEDPWEEQADLMKFLKTFPP